MDPTTYSAFLDELIKIADVDPITDSQSAVQPDEQTPPMYREHPAATLAKGIGTFAVGAGLGYAGGHLADRAVRAFGGEGIPRYIVDAVGPVATGAAGLGFSYLQHKMMDRIKANTQKGPTRDEQLAQDTGF